METTITSPNGRSSTAIADDDAGGYKQSFNARAEALLAWDWNDVGEYLVSSRHYSECPVTEFGNTFLSFPVGISVTCYEYGYTAPDGINVYVTSQECTNKVTCYAPEVRKYFCNSDYLLRTEGWFGPNRTCSALVDEAFIPIACGSGACRDLPKKPGT
ncbi:MAG: hypothetical protein ABR577_12590 [Pyrinomonadaceae bacterium]